MKDFIASEKFLIGSNGQVGGVAPNAVNDIIKWDGTKWIAGVNPGGNGGGSAAVEPFTTSLNSGSTTYSVVFPEPFDITPSIATDLEITGDGPIIPYTISNLTTNGYDVIFAKEIPNNNYKIHTVFGGGGGGTGGGDSTLSGESLQEIDRQIVSNAVDIFVYNTQQDSDGGAWRERTSHTSWYNEPLNTATRGGRREFPAVAVIVAEADKVTIYDGDDPDLNMWMVFEVNTDSKDIFINDSSSTLTSIAALNGRIFAGSTRTSTTGNITGIDFVGDRGGMVYTLSSDLRIYNGGIAQRNDGLGDSQGSSNWFANGPIVNRNVNDVAMTVLPNAPIDADTGLPIPTIAVATDGGVSVIRDDGSVVDVVVGLALVEKIAVNSTHIYFQLREGAAYYVGGMKIPNQDKTLTGNLGSEDFRFNNKNWSSTCSYAYTGTSDILFIDREGVMNVGVDQFLAKSTSDHFAGHPDLGSQCYISSSYNTGWMPGDIKLATLSDTKVEKVGVDESTELVTNGEFDSNIDGWTAFEHAGSTPTIEHDSTNGGRLKVTMTGSYTGATQTINNIKSGRYVVSANFVAGTHSNFYIQIAITGEETYLTNAVDLTNTNPQLEFDVPAGTTSIDVRVRGAVGSGIFYADNISVKQTGELITNGTFDDETVGWTEISDPTLTVTDNKLNLKCLNGDNQAGVWQNIGANDPSQKYILSFDIGSFVGDTAANLMVSVNDYFNGAATTGDVEVFSGKENGSYSFGFDGRSAGVMIFFRIYDITGPCSEDTSINISNISVRLAEDDRSVNDNGLQIFGEIDKTPVAPGADLVAYSGFSAENYLMQPYNPDLDFGTGDFCVSLWFNYQSSAVGNHETLFSLGNRATTGELANGSLLFQIDAVTNQFSCYINLVINPTTLYGTPGAWNHALVKRENSIVYIYLNGKKVDEYFNDISIDGSDKEGWQLLVGDIGGHLHYADLSKLALFKMSATAPTAEQIAKIYRDEKVLFTDGAQATLYGTSDSVTALAYDDSENLLHVGTASGRSSFNGLKRVENTDVAVTTAISATEGLVIEQ
jgi:hypothetical protein